MFSRRNPSRSPECLDRERLLDFLEGTLGSGDAEERAVRRHLDGCEPCRRGLEDLRREIETRNLSIALTWREERISCPHRDILAAYHHGSLAAGESEYVRFHLQRIGCPYCAANLEDIEAGERATEAQPEMRDLRDEILRSTTLFLRKRRSS